MRHMPAAMVHGGGGVLFMTTTKFASQKIHNKRKITKQIIDFLNLTTISTTKQQYKITSKNNHANKHPAPSNKLTVEIQYFQMRKMDQR